MNIRKIEHTRNHNKVPILNEEWANKTKIKIVNLIKTYNDKKFTANNMINIQNDMNNLLINETGSNLILVEAEVESNGRLLFNAQNDITKSILNKIYGDKQETDRGSADIDIADKLMRDIPQTPHIY